MGQSRLLLIYFPLTSLHMNVVTDSQVERSEVESVLQSGLFEKAARLERFFRYICEQHFAGRAEHIKEYSIALEALGRPATFDPKKDSIVRVEAHRLRRRLEQFYREEGAAHPVHVVIPNGQYRPLFIVPVFVAMAAAQELPAVEASSAPEPIAILEPPVAEAVILADNAAPPMPPRRNWNRYAGVAAALLGLILCGVVGARLMSPAGRKMIAGSGSGKDEIWTGPANEPASAESRILTGYHGASFVDRQGHTWSADAYYRGGASSSIQPGYFVEGGPDPRILKSRRSGRFRYDIPLRPGAYELHLYFAETEFGQGNPGGGGDSTRIFQVSINGAVRLDGFDPLAEAGSPNRLLEQVFKDVVPAADGKLHLQFEPDSNAAFLNAIELLPSAPGRTHPVRIVAQSGPVTDSDGRLWAADEYYSGGITVTRRNAVVNPSERAIYQGERFGNFSYRIPVASGKYRLTLHFAETYFGTFAFQDDPVNRRLFNVFVNGTALLRNFDVVKEAGGPNRGLEKVFDNLEPNAQGMLLVEFIPVKNYAEVNGIEVVEVE
jgi:Malectin domain